MGLVKLHQILPVGPPPGVDGLVRVTYNEEIPVVAAEHFHQFVLQIIDILELIDHDVFQPGLPFLPDIRMLPEDMQRYHDQIVIIQSEAFLFLIKIPVKQDIPDAGSPVVLLFQRLQRHSQQILVILRILLQLPHLKHIPGIGIGHIPKGQIPLLIDQLQHIIDIRIIQHQEILRVLHGITVFHQYGYTEAMEGIDIARILIPGQIMDPLPHLICGFVRKCHAEDVSRKDTKFLHQPCKPVRERPCLPAAGPCDHAHVPFRRGHSFPLGFIQLFQ